MINYTTIYKNVKFNLKKFDLFFDLCRKFPKMVKIPLFPQKNAQFDNLEISVMSGGAFSGRKT